VGAVGVTIGEGMFTVAVMATVLIIVVLVVLRKIESAFISRRRLFRYQLKTTDISDSLTRLHGLLESEGLRLDDLVCWTFQTAAMNFGLGFLLRSKLITG
jgi:putative Mg2+ transporter-C (MgtC) family protein